LDIGDAMEEELRFSIRKGLEIVELENSDSPFLRPRKNVAYQFDFSRRIIAASDAAARAALLDWLITLAPLGKKPLKVEFTGDNDYWTFANSFVTAGDTLRKINDKNPAYLITFTVTATGFTKTVV
jgi:hypothetical protein